MSIDFDQHATTQLDPRVLEAMLPFFRERSGNPSSLSHQRGASAAAAEAAARELVAERLGAEPREIVWTSGATESNNFAIKGVLEPASRAPGLVTIATEHRSVLDPARKLARRGRPVTVLPAGPQGQIDLQCLAQSISPQTGLVSVMWANNEIGTIAPLDSIAQICQQRGVWLHSDATQAVGKVPVDLRTSGVDLLSFSGHKIYGPPGIGVLVVRRLRGRIPLTALIDGGGQQAGLRSGTLPLPLIVGLAKALELCEIERETTAARLTRLRDRLWRDLSLRIPGLVRHGDPLRSLPHNLNVSLPGVDGDALLVRLQHSELCVSSGAACSSSIREPSHVLTAIGVPGPLARSSVRFGLGKWSTDDEISQAVAILGQIADELRRA